MKEFIGNLIGFGEVNESFSPWQDLSADNDKSRVHREAMLSRNNIHVLARRIIEQSGTIERYENIIEELRDAIDELKKEKS